MRETSSSHLCKETPSFRAERNCSMPFFLIKHYFYKYTIFIENFLIYCILFALINYLFIKNNERNEKWSYHNSVRALVNVPSQRVYPLLKHPPLGGRS